ncbi:hypothetical protein AYI70_g1100 [Smittium culicis]|uniref:DNA-directed RNA polymerase I subunit RPA34 n=1 Tax=Smittium culicis TaxID=133412 RepID=A0A1R1YE31_9FUNG|nr:hypothetical protein AYI70_g1100 [Smittium culicis]
MLILSFEVPREFEKVKVDKQSQFDVSQVDNKEIWILRVPRNFDPSRLSDLEIKVDELNKGEPLVDFKSNTSDEFELYNSGNNFASGGLEIENLKVLLPDLYDSKVYCQAPNSKKTGLIVKEKIVLPDLVKAGEQSIKENVKRPREQLKDMKLMFKPYGFDSKVVKNSTKNHKATNENSDVETTNLLTDNPSKEPIVVDSESVTLNNSVATNSAPKSSETPKAKKSKKAKTDSASSKSPKNTAESPKAEITPQPTTKSDTNSSIKVKPRRKKASK